MHPQASHWLIPKSCPRLLCHEHLGSREVTACHVSSPAWWVYVWTFPTFSDLDTFTVHSQLQLATRSKASITNSIPTSTAMASSWELHKDTLRTLYVDRDETLKSIMAHMRDVLGFTKRYGIHPVLRSLIKAANLATAKASTNDNSRNGASARIVQQ
jgi:hypothetical protein